MNDEQVKWLAEKMGWVHPWDASCNPMKDYYEDALEHGTMMAYFETGTWHLRPAGAWDVVTKMGVHGEVEFWHDEATGWYCHLGGKCRAGISADPIQAVTQAVIAMRGSEQ